MHHSSDMDPMMAGKLDQLRSRLEGEVEQLGATGRFPEGQLTESDEGEIRFRVGYVDGKVVLDFGQPVTWLGMSPKQAKQLAVLLKTHANPVSR